MRGFTEFPAPVSVNMYGFSFPLLSIFISGKRVEFNWSDWKDQIPERETGSRIGYHRWLHGLSAETARGNFLTKPHSLCSTGARLCGFFLRDWRWCVCSFRAALLWCLKLPTSACCADCSGKLRPLLFDFTLQPRKMRKVNQTWLLKARESSGKGSNCGNFEGMILQITLQLKVPANTQTRVSTPWVNGIFFSYFSSFTPPPSPSPPKCQNAG